MAHNFNDYIKRNDVGVAVIANGHIKLQNSAFELKNPIAYMKQKESFFIINHKVDDDFIDAVYIEKKAHGAILIYKKNIDNKIENFQDVLLFLVPVLLFVLLLLANKMIDKILFPINKLINATKDITITKFTEQIEIPKENDEIKELIVSFNAMIKRLQEGADKLDRFNSDVSHELKTPITVIQGEIEITLKKLREPKEYESSLYIIHKQATQIELIVKQLLLLTKYSKNNIGDTFEDCSIDTVLLACIDKFQAKLQERKIKLHIQRIEPVNMKANCMLIELMFVNLIDNAIKYTQKYKNIYIFLYHDTQIHFIIKDEGVGIGQKHIKKITQRFYRADSSRNKKIEGFGLGLNIVKNSVSLHNGTMKIDSQENNGTKIEINL